MGLHKISIKAAKIKLSNLALLFPERELILYAPNIKTALNTEADNPVIREYVSRIIRIMPIFNFFLLVGMKIFIICVSRRVIIPI